MNVSERDREVALRWMRWHAHDPLPGTDGYWIAFRGDNSKEVVALVDLIAAARAQGADEALSKLRAMGDDAECMMDYVRASKP